MEGDGEGVGAVDRRRCASDGDERPGEACDTAQAHAKDRQTKDDKKVEGSSQ